MPRRLDLIPVPAAVEWHGEETGLSLAGGRAPELRSGSDPRLPEEGYILTITSDGALLESSTRRGAAHGRQTWRQLVAQAQREGLPIPLVTIRDAPRFPWRGGHLDVCRHFFPLETVKAYVDWLAWHKFNVFHWHLTEDQGWRLEIKQFPRLTEIGAWREDGNGGVYGGFYTQDEAREIVAYAAEREIVVVPEIELPGHAVAALASYPELGCQGNELSVETRWGVFEDIYCPGKEKVFDFLEAVLGEVCAIFPGPYVHIGGDECPKTRWKSCPNCQRRMREEGLADEEALQSYTIGRIARFMLGQGKRLIGWDEILEGGLAPEATVMSWRGEEGGVAAARAGHDVIMCPNSHCYLDHKQNDDPGETVGRPLEVCTLEQCYSYDPLPAGLALEEAQHVLGSQANLWSEYVRTPEELEYAVFPRICALAEVFWSPAEGRDVEDFEIRLAGHMQLLESRHTSYCINEDKMWVARERNLLNSTD